MFEPIRPTPTNPMFSAIVLSVLIVLFAMRADRIFPAPGCRHTFWYGDSKQTNQPEHAFFQRPEIDRSGRGNRVSKRWLCHFRCAKFGIAATGWHVWHGFPGPVSRRVSVATNWSTSHSIKMTVRGTAGAGHGGSKLRMRFLWQKF